MPRDKGKSAKGGRGGDHDDSSDTESEDFDVQSYRKLLSKIFPSQHLSHRIKELDSHDTAKTKKSGGKGSSPKKSTPVRRGGKKTKKKAAPSSSEEDSGSETSFESDSEGGAINQILDGKKDHKYNIIFTMGGPLSINQAILGDSEDEEWDTDECSDDSCDTSSSSDEDSDATYDPGDMETSSASGGEDRRGKRRSRRTRRSSAKKSAHSSSEDGEDDDGCDVDDSGDLELVTKYKTMVSDMAQKNKKSKLLKSLVRDATDREKKMSKGIKKKESKQRLKNTKQFRTLSRDKDPMNDLRYFRDELPIQQQKKLIKEIEEVKELMKIEKPYRLKLLESDIPQMFKACALKKVNSLRYMAPGEGEYYKLKAWVDAFMRIPFGNHSSLPITLGDGVDKCHTFMEGAQRELDTAVHGLNDAKMQIMQMVGQWIVNPGAVGTAIAIKGPMGTGKTTLVKEGISKILGREFAFIALGGATDSSFLEGHSYTYEGSTWGKIVDILIQHRTMNPVIYFDELDKISDTPKGQEIEGILTHLTDTAQNDKYHDKYFSEIDFDLSKCLFIFSYNDEHKISPILRDRMYRITTKGYKKGEKIEIANNYLLPKIREQCSFGVGDITIPNETLDYIIDSYTCAEEGVRNLKRCLEVIHTKLNLFRLMKEGTNLFEGQIALKVTFPFTVSREICDKLIKRETDAGPPEGMYI